MSINQEQDFFIQWHLTERCNLRCSHCYQTGSRPRELALPEIRKIIREAAEMLRAWEDAYDLGFNSSFNITGGEPFLRSDLYGIIEEVRTGGSEVFLLTNGTLIDREKAAMLFRLGVNGVQVSIEGPRHIHDMIRGEGSYSASLRGVVHLLEAALTVTINVTLSELNIEHCMDIVSLCSSLGVQRLGFSRLVPSGRGAGLLEKMATAERIGKAYGELFSLEIANLKILTGDPVAARMFSHDGGDAGDIPLGGCAAGFSGITILPDGTLVPCRRLPIPIGNVRKDMLREVWATSKVLKMLRDRSLYKGKCGSCGMWSLCRGCRAIAYACSRSLGEQNFLADDPQCFIGR